MSRKFHSAFIITVALLLQSPLNSWSADPIRDRCGAMLARSPESFSAAIPSRNLAELERILRQLAGTHPGPDGPPLRIVMAAVELGKIPGLKMKDGKPVNISAGGVATVLNDIAAYYPRLLKQKSQGELTLIGILMDGISREQMTRTGNIRVSVDGSGWDISLFTYFDPEGTKYIFLDNPTFQRMTASPDRNVRGQSIYTMRGLEAGGNAEKLDEQRIWSALNQGIAQVFAKEQAQIFVPHDSHVAPASFYIHRMGHHPVSAKPLVHNEAYLGTYPAGGHLWDQVRRIWALTGEEMNQYFMHDQNLVMMAPAVRIAEQKEIFSALSVSEGTAQEINGTSARGRTATQIDFFDRVGDLTNGLGKENRPHLNAHLKPGKEPDLRADGITHPSVLQRFTTRGFAFASPGDSPESILRGKAEAKAALQMNFGLSIDPNRPLFVSFARMVHQKGMGFIASNVEHILNRGGQVILGGPVGDDVGAREREAFLKLAERLKATGHPNAREFHFIDGPVQGAVKGLMLAGGDFFPISSRKEPCGLTDCEALYHGTIPIAPEIGGLAKGKSTLLYRAPNPDDQGWQLGEAINQSFALFADRKAFQRRQLAALQEDFSIERNFSRFLQINRIETVGKILLELDELIRSEKAGTAEIQNLIRHRIMIDRAEDVPELLRALRMVHPSRRSPLMTWFLAQYPERSPTRDR